MEELLIQIIEEQKKQTEILQTIASSLEYGKVNYAGELLLNGEEISKLNKKLNDAIPDAEKESSKNQWTNILVQKLLKPAGITFLMLLIVWLLLYLTGF